MLVEFWDFCRPNSMRTLPYLKAWHERYAPAGLRVIGVHCPGFEPSRDERAVRDLQDQMKKVRQLLEANSDMVHALAAELLERDELLGDEVMEVKQ